MIIVKLKGGLGNQMFQYATGRRAAYVNGASLKLDISGYENQVGITPREYMLNVFNIKEDFANSIEILRLKKTFSIFSKRSYVIEKYFHFDLSILKITDNSYLEGNWQSEKYFKDIENIIRKDFVFKKKPDEKNLSTIKKIMNSNSVSIHIRRGDYVLDSKTNKTHGVCDLDYYNRAIGYVTSKIKSPHFFVFSDDLLWAKQNLILRHPCEYIIHNVGKKDYEDMRLMSECKHNIIANSSFSWWGAWLNNNDNKIIVAPRKWYNDQSLNIKDLISENWLRV